jgi:hypothetical protein
MQFYEHAPPIPKKVLAIVHHDLSHIHIHLPDKIKRTPIIKILRKNGYSHLTDMAVRIVKIMKGEPVPKFSMELIDRLHERFQANINNNTGIKIPNVEFLTKEFLRLEGETELVKSFRVHKTRSVFRNATKQLTLLM